jgi:type IV pilus assembly protein PilY1
MKPGRRPRATGLLILLASLLGTLLAGQAGATVTVDQTPLTVESPLAPNIMLMLDDSGSMAWTFMPDICYLNGVSCNSGKTSISSTPTVGALIDANNNGVYYNPTVNYATPIQVNGSAYANATGITSAWISGFNTSLGTVDVTSYALASIGSTSQASNPSGCSYAYTGGGAGTNETCTNGNGASVSGSNVPFSTIPSTSATYTTANVSASSQSACNTLQSNDPAHTSASASYSSNTCHWTDYYHYFIYSTGAAAGPYTTYYVASAAQGCGSQTNCVTETDTSGTSAPPGVAAGQNIANWFSYYRTRILTAKSGLTTAFNNLAYDVRFGFGSIDGNNNNSLPSSQYSANSINVATISPFDQACTVSSSSPCTPGASGTQRANFWTWITGEKASGGTNLRFAIDTIGQYYSTASPWQNSSTDTTELGCRQSYLIATTDGFWNDSYTSAGNVDGTAGSQVRGANGQTYTYSPAAPYSDSYSNTLADVAMKYWVTDLQTSVANEVPTSTEDPAFWQHMTTFTVGLGFTPTGISPSGTTVDQIFAWADGGASISGFSWPQPASNSIYNIADLAHAGVNGHGGFYSATSPQAFSAGISDALKRVVTRNGTGASLAANSTTLQTGTVTYQAIYHSGIWLGELDAYSVNSTSGAISSTPTWKANASNPAPASRNIWTYNPSGSGASNQFIAFSSPSTLSSAEATALGVNSTAQQSMINYLRGDATNEQRKGGNYRDRVINNASSPLGDIIDSQPVYVGAPDPNLYYNKTFTGSSNYATFATNNVSRNPVIWVAANDGMVHGFQASDGSELFAYLPGAVITNGLANLANPNYGSAGVAHQDYNDGQLTVADAYLGGSWHTVLVGSTGRGSTKAVYALDITTPSSPSLLWERSAGDGLANSNYIGEIIGQPVISQTADGTWSVLIGNGYNSSADKSALLQFDLSSGSLTVHQTNSTTSNGLAASAVWFGNATNDVGTIAYAGDLAGNVWSFDLSSSSSSGTLLFSTGTGQPITGGMLAGLDPQTSNVWLFFGTGRYLTQGDLSNTTTQNWYGIIVQAGSGQSASLVTNLSSGTSALVQRSILSQTDPNPNVTPATLGSRTISSATAGDMTGKSGWYINLLDPNVSSGQGERMVTPNEFQGSLLIGTTLIPTSSDPCNPSGTGWIMAINPFTGTNPPSPFFDTTGSGTFTTSAIGFNSIPNNPIFVGNTMLTSFNDASNSSIQTAGTSGVPKRTSWRELFNH